MLCDRDRCGTSFLIVAAILCIVVVIRNCNGRFCLIDRDLIQLLGVGFISCLVVAEIAYRVICITGECDRTGMFLTIAGPSAEAPSLICAGSNFRFVRIIKVSLVYGDRQCLVLVVVLAANCI